MHFSMKWNAKVLCVSSKKRTINAQSQLCLNCKSNDAFDGTTSIPPNTSEYLLLTTLHLSFLNASKCCHILNSPNVHHGDASCQYELLDPVVTRIRSLEQPMVSPRQNPRSGESRRCYYRRLSGTSHRRGWAAGTWQHRRGDNQLSASHQEVDQLDL
jgi:hypothetical protein